jgi:GT2 family glycosyltransferase
MTNEPSVAILILNWNTRHFLEKHLPIILQTSYGNKTIYVIDNDSADGSVEMVKREFPEVKTIEMHSNYGYAKGYNLCMSEIEADYFVLVNSDIKVTTNFIEPIIEFMEGNEEIGICQPKLLSYDDSHMFEYAGAAGGWIDKLGFPFARGRVLLTMEEDEGQYDTPAEIFWASGACMFLKASVYKRIGGFYDYYYMHQEDIDLCWRAQKEGFKIYAYPFSTVFHIGGGSLSWENNLKTFLTFRNNYILITRNLPLYELLPVIGLRLLLDLFGCIYFLIKGKAEISGAMFKAQFAYFYWLLFANTRRKFQPMGFKKCSGIYNGSILIPYFLRGKRKFSEIVQDTQNG